MPDLEELLQPTVEGPPARPLFSVRANFLTAFFGGVYAAALLSGQNSHRLGRLRRDAWIYALATLAWTAALLWFGAARELGTLPDGWQPGGSAARAARWIGQLAALVLFGLVYLRHRPAFRLQEMAGVSPANPWRAALLAIVVSIALTLLMLLVGGAVAGV